MRSGGRKAVRAALSRLRHFCPTKLGYRLTVELPSPAARGHVSVVYRLRASPGSWPSVIRLKPLASVPGSITWRLQPAGANEDLAALLTSASLSGLTERRTESRRRGSEGRPVPSSRELLGTPPTRRGGRNGEQSQRIREKNLLKVLPDYARLAAGLGESPDLGESRGRGTAWALRRTHCQGEGFMHCGTAGFRALRWSSGCLRCSPARSFRSSVL